ncbi:glycosyltransferase family 9 protein [Herbaspirillum robiniae]|uniref:glycosyltransferase family 9 protein n=1 Tax=Herbaspirillum robiniae TaxID=2014887 RepID=UPI003D76C18C
MVRTFKQAMRELNWERNFLVRRWKLRMRYALMGMIQCILRPRRKLHDLSLSSSVKKILIVRNDRIGDMIASTALIRNLSRCGYEIHVSSRQPSLAIIEHNPHVSGTFVYDDSSLGAWLNTIRTIRKEKFDLAVDVRCNRFVDLKNIVFCSYIRTPILAGFNKSNFATFNFSIPYYSPESHVTVQLRTLLDQLHVTPDDLHYELFVSDEIRNKASSFLQSLDNPEGKKIAVFNPFGSVAARFLSDEQISIVCRLLSSQYHVVLIGEKERTRHVQASEHASLFDSQSVLDVIPLIELADIVVSVDTAIVHMATCYQKNTIAFYINTVPVAPVSTSIKVVRSHEMFLLNSKFQDYFQDKKYIISAAPDRTIPVNHLVWAPNNPHAQQIVFDSEPIRDVESALFEAEVAQALKTIHEGEKKSCPQSDEGNGQETVVPCAAAESRI